MFDAFRHVNIVIKSSTMEIFLNNKKFVSENNFNLTSFKIWVQNNLKYKPLYASGNKNNFMSNSCENMELPYISFCFYLLLVKLGHPPTIEQLTERYFSLYMIDNKDGTHSLKEIFNIPDVKIKKEYVEGRIFRSYYSFIRELNAILIAQSINKDFYYNFKKDLKGIDICLGDTLGIASFVATKRSMEFKKRKITTRHKYTVKLLDLPAVMDKASKDYNCINVNGIMLYDEEKVKNTIKAFLKEIDTIQP